MEILADGTSAAHRNGSAITLSLQRTLLLFGDSLIDVAMLAAAGMVRQLLTLVVEDL